MEKRYTLRVMSDKHIADAIHTYAPMLGIEIEHTEDINEHLLHTDKLDVVVAFANYLSVESLRPQGFVADMTQGMKELSVLDVKDNHHG
jgi:hypothetical protein